MKIFPDSTIALVFVVIVTALFTFLSSLCAIANNATSDRTVFSLFTLAGLAVAVGAVMRIAKKVRKP
jgi:divalent metal cation (Fe/Co/Zn/Cd) transporter